MSGDENEYSKKCSTLALNYLKLNPKKLAEYLTNGFYSEEEFDIWSLALSKSFTNDDNSVIIDELELEILELLKNESLEFKNTISTLFSEIRKEN